MNSSVVAVLFLVLAAGAATSDVNCGAETSCKLCINGTLAGKCAWCDADSKCLPYDPVTNIKALPGCSGSKFYASNCIGNNGHQCLLFKRTM